MPQRAGSRDGGGIVAGSRELQGARPIERRRGDVAIVRNAASMMPTSLHAHADPSAQ